jgi:hypothetical protein
MSRFLRKRPAALESFGEVRERYGDRHLAAGRGRQPRKRTQGNGESGKKLTAARRQMTRRVGTARRKGRGHKGPNSRGNNRCAKKAAVE